MRDRKLNRLRNRDYSESGLYFVTVCTYKMEELFGSIVDGRMGLSQLGGLVKECWVEIPEHFKGVGLDKFRIMPNHIHGIIWVKEAAGGLNVGNAYMRSLRERFRTGGVIEEEYMRSVRERFRNNMLIPKIIQNFKAAVSRKADGKVWHKSYHDRVIRNNKELEKIRGYIENNPVLWVGKR